MRPTLEQLLPPSELAAFNALLDHPGVNGPAAHRWLRERGHAVGINAVYGYLRRLRPDAPRAKKPLKIDRLLTPEDLRAFEELAANPGVTIRELHGLLDKLNYKLSLGAVQRKAKVLRVELTEVKRCARLAMALTRVTESAPPDVHNRGALLGLDQVVFQQVYELREKGEVGPREISEWADALERVIAVREHIETLQRKAARAREKSAAKSTAARPRTGIANGVEIANTVRRILGVPLPGEPLLSLPAPEDAEPRTSDPDTPSPPPSPEGRGSEPLGIPTPVEPPAPYLPLPAGEGGGEGV